MEKGLNSDISLRGVTYHVQTEDWGPENPFLVSRVFRNGAVVKSVKTPRQEALLRGSVVEAEALRQALRQQHSQILDLLVSGQLI